MALLHAATIVPSKSELVGAWLPGRSWAPAGPVVDGVSFRLDDPAGQVGMEVFLLTAANGVVVQVPLTYRSAPLAGAEQHLLGTVEHSVLGTRWVHDGCADPVFVTTLAATIATGGTHAEELLDDGQSVTRRDTAVHVEGSGSDDAGPSGPWVLVEDGHVTRSVSEHAELVVARRVGAAVPHPLTLTARWADRAEVTLAGLRLR